jgi:hypothetical protein
MQEQVRKQRNRAMVEQRVAARPVCMDGVWHALQRSRRTPARRSAPPRRMARGPLAQGNFMKLAKLSIPRRPVRGSRLSSMSGIRSHTRMRSPETPTASSCEKSSFVMPISFR